MPEVRQPADRTPQQRTVYQARRVDGTLEAYVCTECGYHETYVKERKQIAWDKLVGFSSVNPATPSSGPFR